MVSTKGKKLRLAKAGRQTRWAPFWVIPKMFGLKNAKHQHPYLITAVKRSWKRDRIKA